MPYLFHLLRRKHFIRKRLKALLLSVSYGGVEELVSIRLTACLYMAYDVDICCLRMLHITETQARRHGLMITGVG